MSFANSSPMSPKLEFPADIPAYAHRNASLVRRLQRPVCHPGKPRSAMQPPSPVQTDPAIAGCKICTIRLEQICYRRAWWFRAFREVLASGIRLFAIAYGLRSDRHPPRSAMCYRCLRFRKNALKQRSALFNRLDAILNPVFNRVRDSLLTPAELDSARGLAQRAAEADFVESRRPLA
jgi:hypothetical protein